MRDIPIIMSAPMVQACLREVRRPGTGKTQTRRLAWLEPRDPSTRRIRDCYQRVSLWQSVEAGDRLWVRESGAFAVRHAPIYRADGEQGGWKWTPSIHMPRWASRLTLIITATKIERLQNITDEDAQAEGIVEDDGDTADIWYIPGAAAAGWKIQMAARPASVFKSLWIALHGADAWDANPEVVALTFTVHLQNIDAIPKAVAA